LVRLLSDLGHADEESACSQAGPASNKKVLKTDHRGSKDSAGLSTRRQRVTKGNEEHPYSPSSSSSTRTRTATTTATATATATAKEVGIETKRARSKPEKTQQPSLDPAPNPSIAKAEATDTQPKFKEVWALYEKRGKSEP
jgi:hypothetical protein